jgi:hypothetical protein
MTPDEVLSERDPRTLSSIPRHVWRCGISHQLTSRPFQLTPQELRRLLQLIQARRTPQAIVKRAQIVVSASAHPDWSSQRLAQSLSLDARLIRNDDAGKRRIRSRMLPDREGHVGFHQRCVPR